MKRSFWKRKKTVPLKRSGFKQKLTVPMKHTPLKRKSKSIIRKVQDLLWEECKRITRATYGNTCYTCGKTGLVGSSWHTGHFIPNAVGGAILRYELMNLRPQCYRCNIDLSGNGAVFYRKLVEVEGQEYVDHLFEMKNKFVLQVSLLEHYTRLLNEYRQM
jgi:hypothetical protein